MNPTNRSSAIILLNGRKCALWSLCATASFHLAYEVPWCAPLIVVYFVGLLQLARAGNPRNTIYSGWIVGLCIYAPQLSFFWSIFHQAAIILWLILSTWLVCFLLLQRFAWCRLGPVLGTVTAPLLWMGVEYFRSELYLLRFSWLNAGYLLPTLSHWTGMYGAGFAVMSVSAFATLAWMRRAWWPAAIAVAVTVAGLSLVTTGEDTAVLPLSVAGVQLEGASDAEIVQALDRLYANFPATPLFVLSEYSFQTPVPKEIKAWCARHKRWLIAGGKEMLDLVHLTYRNTAFVIGPDGAELFSQAKSQPIQFFDDGLPAARQGVWDSPWGKLGLCICYDLSYTRVTDSLIRQGAQAIIVPTMDVEEWGGREHALHARVAPTRASEYGVPVFRLCSSGISQAVDRNGRVLANAAFPGQGQTLAATLRLPPQGGRMPIDRIFAWPCMGFAVLLSSWQLLWWMRTKMGKATL